MESQGVVSSEELDSLQHTVHRLVLRNGRVAFRKRYQGRMSWWTLDSTDIWARERRAQSLRTDYGLPVPSFCDEQESSQTVWMDECEGRSLAEHCGPGRADAQIWRQVGAMVGRLHRLVKCPDSAGWDACEWPRCHERLAEALRDVCAGPDRDRLERQLVLWREFAAAFFTDSLALRRAVVLHGDLHPGNVFGLVGDSGSGRVTGLLDWEESVRGHPAIDLAQCRSGILHYAPTAQAARSCTEALVSGYNADAGPGDWMANETELQVWADFIDVRDRIVSAWVRSVSKRRSIQTRVEAWILDDE